MWTDMFKGMRSPGITGETRAFNGEADTCVIRMRMLVIWEAQQTMELGASERDNPTAFLA
jgi:hypothetical protein